MSVDFTNWIRELCPNIAEWQAELIVEAIDKAVAAEREACAKVCDAEALRVQKAELEAELDEVRALRSTAWKISVCAAAIRARGE